MFPPHFGHLPIGSLPVKSIFGSGSRGVPSFALPALGSRGANSNAVQPSLMTRNALNARLFFLEINFVSKSVLPVSSIFFTCAASIGCCKIILPVLNVQVLSGPVAFSQR